jgi:polar amino acid transport system substrate-binding protein
MFCRDCGYALEITEMNFDGILASVQSGKSDIGCTSISVTEERKESMLFSEPDYSGGTALVVLKDGPDRGDSLWASVCESFEKTFIRENRWQLFLQGIGTTLLITCLSILFGTALGFLVFMLCRNGNPVANTVTRFCVWLVRGMPAVVLLMILYYIIFGNVSISGTAVSVVGFTLVFGAGVYGTVKAGVGAIDRGQLEAAYALGYTNRRAFYRVILPQALPHFMPAYKGSVTEIIKATAIVGYVAVQDLTKMGDIVRSRTYEAFFPLIAVAVIYFILAAVLTRIVDRIERKLDPRLRTPEEIRKEVEGL